MGELTVVHRYSGWKELFVKNTSKPTAYANYLENKKSKWMSDRMYVYESWIDFSNVKQFFIHRSPIFKIKFDVKGIVGDQLIDLKLNATKIHVLIILSLVQFLVLIFFLMVREKHFMFYPMLLFSQAQIIAWTLASSRQTHNDQLHFLLRWF